MEANAMHPQGKRAERRGLIRRGKRSPALRYDSCCTRKIPVVRISPAGHKTIFAPCCLNIFLRCWSPELARQRSRIVIDNLVVFAVKHGAGISLSDIGKLALDAGTFKVRSFNRIKSLVALRIYLTLESPYRGI